MPGSKRLVNNVSSRARLMIHLHSFVIAVFIGTASATVLAQQADPAQLQQALNRAQGLLRQLAQQKGALEAGKATMQASIAQLEKKLAQTEAKISQLEIELQSKDRDIGISNTTLMTTRQRLDRVETRLKEVVAKYKRLETSNQATLQEKATLEETLAATEDALNNAKSKNEEMFQANKELLERFLNKSPLDAFLQREPLTGIKQVEMENIQQEYQFRLEDARISQSSGDRNNDFDSR